MSARAERFVPVAIVWVLTVWLAGLLFFGLVAPVSKEDEAIATVIFILLFVPTWFLFVWLLWGLGRAVVQSEEQSAGHKALWLIAFLSLAPFAFLAYWYRHIRQPEPR